MKRTYEEWLKYYENATKEQVIEDMMLDIKEIYRLNKECDTYMKIATKKDKEIDRLNNIINELQWKPIEKYEKPKYDWVLVKYYIEPEFECIPTVAEERFGKWYDGNNNEIIGEVRYFMDMQLLDKLKELKESDK